MAAVYIWTKGSRVSYLVRHVPADVTAKLQEAINSGETVSFERTGGGTLTVRGSDFEQVLPEAAGHLERPRKAARGQNVTLRAGKRIVCVSNPVFGQPAGIH